MNNIYNFSNTNSVPGEKKDEFTFTVAAGNGAHTPNSGAYGAHRASAGGRHDVRHGRNGDAAPRAALRKNGICASGDGRNGGGGSADSGRYAKRFAQIF